MQTIIPQFLLNTCSIVLYVLVYTTSKGLSMHPCDYRYVAKTSLWTCMYDSDFVTNGYGESWDSSCKES